MKASLMLKLSSRNRVKNSGFAVKGV